MGMMPGGWVAGLVAETFFVGCPAHEASKKNEKNIFCLGCCASICAHCAPAHRRHPLLQVRHQSPLSPLLSSPLSWAGPPWRAIPAAPLAVDHEFQLLLVCLVQPGQGTRRRGFWGSRFLCMASMTGDGASVRGGVDLVHGLIRFGFIRGPRSGRRNPSSADNPLVGVLCSPCGASSRPLPITTTKFPQNNNPTLCTYYLLPGN
jgi:hypothetical protein